MSIGINMDSLAQLGEGGVEVATAWARPGGAGGGAALRLGNHVVQELDDLVAARALEGLRRPTLFDETSEVRRAVLWEGRPLPVDAHRKDDLDGHEALGPRALPRVALVHDHGQAVYVHLLRHFCAAIKHLWSHVERRAADLGGQEVAPHDVLMAAQPKVDELGAPVGVQEDVGGLEVAVHDGGVQVRQALRDVAPQAKDLEVAQRRGAAAVNARLQGAARDVLLHDAALGGAQARTVQLDNAVAAVASHHQLDLLLEGCPERRPPALEGTVRHLHRCGAPLGALNPQHAAKGTFAEALHHVRLHVGRPVHLGAPCDSAAPGNG
mmetsp:Transcript_38261/g.99374  ORF Transcript_38261/g.99374 Transcript_38261/m.99374 type:complete len:324 (-) Transcript_38261:697-1668(-)